MMENAAASQRPVARVDGTDHRNIGPGYHSPENRPSDNSGEPDVVDVWVGDARTSLGLGVVVFVLFLVPGLVWQYRRHGVVNIARMIGWAMVCLYVTALFVYTLLPLPDDGKAWCAAHTASSNLEPFAFIDDIRRRTADMTLFQAARSRFVLQAVFNVVLFMPLGIVMRRYFGRGIIASTLLGFALSTFIEVSQYTGLFGLYPCAYRVGDVDDIMMNTAGAFLGAVLAPVFLWWMPTARALASTRLEPRPVTSRRRWMGMALDALLFALVTTGADLCIRVGTLLVTGRLQSRTTLVEDVCTTLVGILVVFVLPAWRGRGASIGQTIVWLTPKWLSRDGTVLTDGSGWRRVVRSVVVVGTWSTTGWIAQWVRGGSDEVVDLFSLPGAIVMTGVLIVLVAIVMVPGTRTHRSLSGLVTGALVVDARDPIAGGPLNKEPLPLTEVHRDLLGLPRQDVVGHR